MVRCIHNVPPRPRPRPRAQLFLDCDAWLHWSIPYFNSFSYSNAATLASLTTALTATYFIRSALRAQHYLSNDDANGGDGGTNVTNKAAMRRLMRRVLASGCVMLVITVAFAIGTTVIFHPPGFAALFSGLYFLVMVNSLLLIDSFVPATGVPIGPLREASLVVTRGAHRLMDRCEQWLASSSSSAAIVHVAQSRRLSHIDRQGRTLLRSVAEATQHSQQNATDAPNDDQLKPWERPGVSLRFLESFVCTHNITPTMTTTDVMERIIKPETAARKCCYVELLSSDDRCPPQWLGKATHFASHWWGYSFLELVGALRAFSATCAEPPFFFLDTMAINQHTFFLGSTSSQATQESLLHGLHSSLNACGNLLLCCMAGPGGEPGWMSPAPFKRIWCLFEVSDEQLKGRAVVHTDN